MNHLIWFWDLDPNPDLESFRVLDTSPCRCMFRRNPNLFGPNPKNPKIWMKMLRKKSSSKIFNLNRLILIYLTINLNLSNLSNNSCNSCPSSPLSSCNLRFTLVRSPPPISLSEANLPTSISEIMI